MLKGVHV